MKKFTRIQPTTVQEVGDRFKDRVVIKRYQTEDGLTHEFTTFYKEGVLAVATLALTEDNRAIVVREFPLIDIPVYEQERIVAEIHAEINKQEKLKAGISDIQQQIDQIVEDCISQ